MKSGNSRHNPILCVDVGNTSIGLGVFRQKKLVGNLRLPTHPQKEVVSPKGSVKRYSVGIGKLFKKKLSLGNIDGVIVCSVVPKALVDIKKAVEHLFGFSPLVVGEDLEPPIPNLYDNPEQVGEDRLVNAVSALRLYGPPAIIVDFGTAVTFDLVSRKGQYLGGIIAPGIEISLKALSKSAALLPEIELKAPKSLLGKDTVNSMRSGVLYGFGSLCDGMVAKLKAEFGKQIKVIATGGYAQLIATYCSSIDEINPYLTLEGLRIIYEELTRITFHGET